MDDERAENPEIMADFFNKRVETYDDHMKENVESFDQFYESISSCVAKTRSKIRILDIGCGTGLELKWVFERAPNATITAVDISSGMLHRLLNRYKEHQNRIIPIQGSYLNYCFNKEYYDYVIAVYTLHHLLPDAKRELYQRILNSLKSRGIYIEGDYIVSKEKECELLSIYKQISKKSDAVTNGSHHIDIPMSLETQKHLLMDAGFSKMDIIWEKSRSAVYAARP
ncbi:methyltransferase domain-containing protein [Chloroflexota bacterium]